MCTNTHTHIFVVQIMVKAEATDMTAATGRCRDAIGESGDDVLDHRYYCQVVKHYSLLTVKGDSGRLGAPVGDDTQSRCFGQECVCFDSLI